jgi:BirA family biotin operon repressor/biotin-[acetyl-CoA-carboxylase] ligase
LSVARDDLSAARLAAALVRPGGLWTDVHVVAQTGSTNADVLAAARAGAGEGLVLIADNQVAGRGRLGRSWQAPPGAALTMSALVRPRSVPPAQFGWLSLLAGVAVVQAFASVAAEVDTALKWPNDVLVRPAGTGPAGAGSGGADWAKCGGILAEVEAADAVVIGIGLNVHQRREELPAPADPAAYPPTSLAVAGASGNRERIAIAVLEHLAQWYRRWHDAAGDPVRSGLVAEYRARCLTVGQVVSVTLPAGGLLRGTATDVDRDGRLVVRVDGVEHRLAAGDVHHVRGPAAGRSGVAPDTDGSAEALLA